MLDFNGTEQYGVTWNFESYYKASEFDDSGEDPTCHLVSDIEEVVVRGTPFVPVGRHYGGGGGGVGVTPPPQLRRML
ncbi:MAG: hypothetical protein F4Z87_08700 [Gammaproteobacteria bacterium]|nr:hypothetical protein [Gammaproteobacteria bacterium]